jgi:AcrR family transcriptional regulator
MSERRGDTREKIRSVALELFAEHGYDKTSLREIAERLGVTKAALYYHFKSKEDIVASLVDDLYQKIDEIIAWGERQPRTLETRQEIVRRYAKMTQDQGSKLAQFMQENRAAVQELKSVDEMRERFTKLAQLVTDPHAALVDQLRARMTFLALNGGTFLLRDLDATDDERYEAALTVALELVGGL